MDSFAQSPWPTWSYSDVNDSYLTYGQYPNYSAYLADSMEAYQTHHQHLVHHHQMSRTTESKPRLSKEEVETLEAEFQKNHKPNSTTKKALAESMRVENARINNWFQNRRAREKKERNIREYEARQKLEKEKDEAEFDRQPLPDRNSDLVASSAPFPNAKLSAQPADETRKTPSRLRRECEDSESYHSDKSNDANPPEIPYRVPDGPFGFPEVEGVFCNVPTDQFSHFKTGFGDGGGDCTSPSNGTPDANEPDFSLSTDDDDRDYYVKQIRRVMGGEDFHASNAFLGYETENLPEFPPGLSSDTGKQLRSPPSIDIASRRNRRPPSLAINGSRSYSSGTPKTATDMGRRGEICKSMRRAASATGAMRMSKSMGIPRSPFQLHQSLTPTGLNGRNAPPTPDSPILGNQPTVSNASDPGSGNMLSASDFTIRDPTLRTPPTTPGVMQSFFSLNSVYDIPTTEENLVTPAMTNFPGHFDMPTMTLGTPDYLASASQSQTPSFASSVNPSSFGVTGGNAGYTWPCNSVSGNSLPTDDLQNHQFINMPVSNLGMER